MQDPPRCVPLQRQVFVLRFTAPLFLQTPPLCRQFRSRGAMRRACSFCEVTFVTL